MQPTAGQKHTHILKHVCIYTHVQEIGAHTNILGIDE